MSDTFQDDPDTRRAVEEFKRMLRQKSKQEREALLRQARDEALAEELQEEREVSEREAAALRDNLRRDSPQEEAARARKQATSAGLLLIMLLLILWLIAAAIGRSDILRFPGAQPLAPTLQPRLSEDDSGISVAMANARETAAADMAPIGSLATPIPQIDSLFQPYYDQHGGERIFGRPISPVLEDSGRKFQWFERARLEQWPEHAGTPYEIQGGLLGYEFTSGLTFPTQEFFVSQPSVRYFPETRHGVADRFLQFWDNTGGLSVLGYPISEQLQEVLSDKQIHTVQYFERGRIEYHPENAGTPFEMQLGLLGSGLLLKESRPNLITPAQPTSVPLPVSAR